MLAGIHVKRNMVKYDSIIYSQTSACVLYHALLTLSSISFVWAADKQNLARDSIMGVAGKPTTTIPSPLFKHSLPRALK